MEMKIKNSKRINLLNPSIIIPAVALIILLLIPKLISGYFLHTVILILMYATLEQPGIG
jgi:uncharacterized membrane protein